MRENMKAAKSLENSKKKKTQLYEVWERLRVQPVAVICMTVLLIVISIAIFADMIADYRGKALMVVAENKLLSPSREHIFGTDNFGRDMFARTIHGTRTVLLVAISATLIATVIGTFLSCCATLFGGKVDLIIMRFIDVLTAIPNLIIAIAVCAGLGGGIWQLIVALTLSSITGTTRMQRSRAITIVHMEYIESAKALGAGTIHIITRHLVPNLTSIIFIGVTGSISTNIMMISSLGFIGLGVPPPHPELGLMLNNGVTYMARYPYMVIIPGMAILIISLCISTFGDMLRDAFDPMLKGRA
jgi:peptide/nickel transport system permease protein